MSEQDGQVLSDDEKNALLAGVESGAVEVRSAGGPTYADVRPYVIGPRARLVSNSLPRLEKINEQLATRLTSSCADLLAADVEVTASGIRIQSFGDFRDSWPSRSVSVAFTAAPLPGQPLVVVDPVLVGPLVEAFFGGTSPESAAHNDVAHSAGSLGTVQLFVGEVLDATRELWAPLRKIAPDRAATHPFLDLVESVEAADRVVVCEFELTLGEDAAQRGSFGVVWPETTLAPVRPALEGRRQDRDAAEDARWGSVLRHRLPDVVVPLSSQVGRARMTLGQVVALKPGDVIGIDTPRVATLLAAGVPLLEGRFGVQAGRNAVETVSWLEVEAGR